MDAVTLSDLGPILAAVLGPMLLFVAASMRYQHIDGTRTRELIAESNEDPRPHRRIQRATSSQNPTRRTATSSRRTATSNKRRTRDLIDRDLIEKSNKDSRPHRQEPQGAEPQPRGCARAVGPHGGLPANLTPARAAGRGRGRQRQSRLSLEALPLPGRAGRAHRPGPRCLRRTPRSADVGVTAARRLP